jgi:hypothetical protein
VKVEDDDNPKEIGPCSFCGADYSTATPMFANETKTVFVCESCVSNMHTFVVAHSPLHQLSTEGMTAH